MGGFVMIEVKYLIVINCAFNIEHLCISKERQR